MNKPPGKIKNMFNKIADNYDKMNNIISFGTDKIIKLNCIKQLNIQNEMSVLDLCTGTGDIARIIKRLHPKTKVTGVDFSEKMLDIAQIKAPEIEFIKADCTHLPFKENTFDVITISYGLRNIENRRQAISEIYRILKPDGQVMHLDFGEKNFAGKIFENLAPIIAKIFSTAPASYEYLVKSKQDFPPPDELIKEFEGFYLKKRCDFLFKSISCQIFEKIRNRPLK